VHDELVELIWAESANDAPREVYADWLAERGDARGEFIALQLREARGIATPAEIRRAKQLLAQHSAAWLGAELAVVLTVERFERGFLTAAKVKRGSPAIVDVSMLATRELWFIEDLHNDFSAIQLAPAMRSLRSVMLRTEAEVATALDRREPHRWQHVSSGPELTYERMFVKAVASPAFRRVPHLEIWVWPDSLERLVELSRRFGWPNPTELAKLTLARGAGFPTEQDAVRAKLHALGVASLAREVTSRDMYGNSILL
jgi:uncharacterized protein (TIGR02996 family)